MLWKYGFDESLGLEPSAYDSVLECKPEEEIQVGRDKPAIQCHSSVSLADNYALCWWLQLSEYGRQTLTRWFLLHDVDGDGVLDKPELLNFFGPLALHGPHPFAQPSDYTDTPVLLPVGSKGSLPLRGTFSG